MDSTFIALLAIVAIMITTGFLFVWIMERWG
jgi:hypothetical protein